MITTGCGDGGKSCIVGQSGISKSDLIFEVLGTIDELSAFLGLAKYESNSPVKESLEEIQNELLKAAGNIACGCEFDFEKGISDIEKNMQSYNPDKVCPNKLVLYGETKSGACIDMARAVARRLERLIVRFFESGRTTAAVVAYFNRMSDYLFVLARFTEKGGNL